MVIKREQTEMGEIGCLNFHPNATISQKGSAVAANAAGKVVHVMAGLEPLGEVEARDGRKCALMFLVIMANAFCRQREMCFTERWNCRIQKYKVLNMLITFCIKLQDFQEIYNPNYVKYFKLFSYLSCIIFYSKF